MYRTWVVTRIARRLLIPIYLAYIIAFLNNRPSYLTWNGQLEKMTEVVMFGVPAVFMILGLLEMALREKGGIPRARNFGFRPEKNLAPSTSQLKR